MEKITAVEKFIHENGFDKINDSLKLFAKYHVKKLPNFLLDNQKRRVMLDILKIRNQNVFLPVSVGSTFWLRVINDLNEKSSEACLHNERWPFRQRFILIGLYPEDAFCNHLERSFGHLTAHGLTPKVSVSERVASLAISEDLKSLIKEVQVIELFEEYKAEEVDVF